MSDDTMNPFSPVTSCPATGYQTVSVCVPVTVTPSATAGTPTTTCCGDPIVEPVVTPRDRCEGMKNGSCTFNISQVICVSVPVEFSATATVGDTYVDCVDASGDMCPNCDVCIRLEPNETILLSDYKPPESITSVSFIGYTETGTTTVELYDIDGGFLLFNELDDTPRTITWTLSGSATPAVIKNLGNSTAFICNLIVE